MLYVQSRCDLWASWDYIQIYVCVSFGQSRLRFCFQLSIWKWHTGRSHILGGENRGLRFCDGIQVWSLHYVVFALHGACHVFEFFQGYLRLVSDGWLLKVQIALRVLALKHSLYTIISVVIKLDEALNVIVSLLLHLVSFPSLIS